MEICTADGHRNEPSSCLGLQLLCMALPGVIFLLCYPVTPVIARAEGNTTIAENVFPSLHDKRLFMSLSAREKAARENSFINESSLANEIPLREAPAKDSPIEISEPDSDIQPQDPVIHVRYLKIYYNGLIKTASSKTSIWIDGDRYIKGRVPEVKLLRVEPSGLAVFRSTGMVHRVSPGESFRVRLEAPENLP